MAPACGYRLTVPDVEWHNAAPPANGHGLEIDVRSTRVEFLAMSMENPMSNTETVNVTCDHGTHTAQIIRMARGE